MDCASVFAAVGGILCFSMVFLLFFENGFEDKNLLLAAPTPGLGFTSMIPSNPHEEA
jgi:hypothetical protein